MPLKVTFELSDNDLRHFRKIMQDARKTARAESERETIAKARDLLVHVRGSAVPDFVRDRLLHIDKFLVMLDDSDWALTGANRERILSALAYFNEPVDLIPDHIPGFGFIDDAVMVELVCQELKHDIEAYDDFCTYRKQHKKKRAEADLPSTAMIEARRKQLQARMQRRRKRRAGRRRRGSTTSPRSPFSLW